MRRRWLPVIRKALLLSTTALLLVGLYVLANHGSSDASVPAPVRYEYSLDEGDSVDVTLAASHVDGLPGCTELTFATANVTGGALEDPTDVACAAGATLADDVDAAATSLPVVTTAGFPGSGTLRIGDEIVTYASKTDNSFGGVARAAGGTTAASHSAGATASQAELENAPLDQNHNDVETTIVLSGTGLGFPSSGVIQITAESITYSSVTEVDDTTELGDAARGAFGTNGEAHHPDDVAYLSVSTSADLTDDIDASQTTIPLDSVAGLADPDGSVQIGEELITYSGVATTALDCAPVTEPCITGAIRGVGESDAEAHSNGDHAFQSSSLDTDAATTTFDPGANYFGLGAQLTDDISDAAIFLPASATAGLLQNAFPAMGTAAIGDEVFTYTGIASLEGECDPLPEPCFTGVTRGVGGTEAVAHTTGDMIYQSFFTYTVAHNPTSDPIVIGAEVTPENDPPAVAGVVANVENAEETADVDVVAEDIDGDSGENAEGDCELGFSIETPPQHGDLEPIVNHDCTSNPPNTDDTPNTDSATVTYTSDETYTGQDSFTVMVCDDDACTTADVTVMAGTPTPAPTPTPTPGPTPSPTPSPTPAPTPLPWEFGDMDCDGDVDAVDALGILLVLAGFDPLQPDDPDCPMPGDAPPTPQPTATPSPTPAPTPTPTPAPTPTPV